MSAANGLRLKIHCGPLVDKYLASEGAIAQAVDQKTILLRSSVFKMSVSEQRLILLHELAHLQQLARPGNDPARALEDEAWEAARAWSSIRPYRIRGRAKNPLNAYAIVQGGERGHPSAPPWYGSNPVEPIGNNSTITVKDVVVLKDMTLESVMDSIIQKKEKEVVIVCHGITEGLLIPFSAEASLNVMQEFVVRLAADHPGKVGGINLPVYKDNDVAHQLSEEVVKRLRGKMNQIRGLKLDHVAFRACDMGKSPDATMVSFRDLFGAVSVSAPKLKDSYGQFTALIDKDVAAFAEIKRKREGFRVWIDHGVAFGLKTAKTSMIAFQIVCKARDKDALAAWTKAHVTDRPPGDDAIVFHGMNEDFDHVPDQKAPVIYFVRDKSFIDNIVYYAG